MSLYSSQDQAFLRKLTEIILANITNNQFGVSELAKEVGMSRSNLYSKVKEITQKSVSQFIREIRLNKAKELLTKDNLTVSEVAYNVGFGSPSYFIKCFHKKFGDAPGDFLKRKIETTEFDSEEIALSSDRVESVWKLKKKWQVSILVVPIILLLVIVGNYFTGKNRQVELEKSIAVLPLKNTGNDQETQFLADGIMEDILNRLSHVKDLKVKSRISSEKYYKTDLSLPEIGKEMNVSYVLEGSILKGKETIRIYIQLIEAKSDDHVWSKQYDRELNENFTFVSDVSRQITDELKIVLSSKEIQQIEKVFTENTEAYRLYQKGRFFWHRRTEESLNKSLEYFNQALQLDSTYALAYAGLADAYYQLAFYGWYPRTEGLSKGKEYALKALNLDNGLAEAYTTLGGIASNQANWELAEKEFKQAIKLNPNYANAHFQYAFYLFYAGTLEEARKHLDLAIELNPNARMMYVFSSGLYYADENYSEALKASNKAMEFNRNSVENWGRFKILFRLKKDSEAIDVLLKILSRDMPGIDYKDTLLSIYSESGINGIMLWEADRQLKRENPRYHRAAEIYSLAGEKENAMDYLEKTYEISQSAFLGTINKKQEFYNLHDEPRFKALLEKLNLTLE